MRPVLLCATASVLFSACSTKPPMVGDPGPKVEDDRAERAYQDILDRFTHHTEIYATLEQGKDTRVFFEATYQSWAFRQARVRRMGIFQVQPPEEVARNLTLEQAGNAQFYEIVLGAFVNNYHYEDFNRPDSIWRIALVTPGGELTPVSIDRIGRADLALRAIYPYMSDFWVAYRIRFAKAVGAASSSAPERVLFRVASSLGKSEMWFPTE